MTRPVVLLSSCLADTACRYDGQAVRDAFVAALAPHVSFARVCPEVEIGLPVPRKPLRLVEEDGEVRMLQPATGRDVTDDMTTFAQRRLDGLGAVDGFLLKGRSPSCGIAQVKIHAPDGHVLRHDRGLFARAVVERYPHVAVEEEGRLSHQGLRDHFLTRIFASARLRAVCSKAELVAFHARHKFLLLAHGQASMRALGRVVANAERRPWKEVRAAYARGFAETLARPARKAAWINVFEHVFGFVSDDLGAREKRHFLSLLGAYRASRVPASAVTTLLRSWVERFEIAYLGEQALFDPYPPALVSLRDSGKGRGA